MEVHVSPFIALTLCRSCPHPAASSLPIPPFSLPAAQHTTHLMRGMVLECMESLTTKLTIWTSPEMLPSMVALLITLWCCRICFARWSGNLRRVFEVLKPCTITSCVIFDAHHPLTLANHRFGCLIVRLSIEMR